VGQAIGQLLPLALGVALSPVAVIVVILMLFSERAKSNGPAFLAGWLSGVCVVAGLALALSDAASVGSDAGSTDAASWVKLALGLLLLAGALRQLRGRPAPGESAAMPKWMAGVDGFTAPRAFRLALALAALKPKNLILAAAAGTTIAQAGLPGGQQLLALAIFVFLSSLTIAIPVLYHALGGEHARNTMNGWKAWLAESNAAVMAVLFLVFGVLLVGQAIQTLAG